MKKTPIKNFDQSLQKIEDLHGNMAVLSRLSPLLNDPNSDISDAARLIQSDTALTTSIVRISNSAFYGNSQKVGDVQSALGKVGFNQTLRLVGMALSKQVFMKDLKVYGISADSYWCQSYFTGLFLEEVAGRLGFNKDDAYMLGLLHSVGKVVLNELIEPEDVEVYWDPTFSPEEWEDIMFGLRHNEAGALLLERWNFPESIFQRIRNQGDANATESDMMLAAISFIVEVLNTNYLDFDRETWTLPEVHPFYEMSRSEPEILESEIARTRKNLEQVRRNIVSADGKENRR